MLARNTTEVFFKIMIKTLEGREEKYREKNYEENFLSLPSSSHCFSFLPHRDIYLL